MAHEILTPEQRAVLVIGTVEQRLRIYGHFRYPASQEVFANKYGLQAGPVRFSGGTCGEDNGGAAFNF